MTGHLRLPGASQVVGTVMSLGSHVRLLFVKLPCETRAGHGNAAFLSANPELATHIFLILVLRTHRVVLSKPGEGESLCKLGVLSRGCLAVLLAWLGGTGHACPEASAVMQWVKLPLGATPAPVLEQQFETWLLSFSSSFCYLIHPADGR